MEFVYLITFLTCIIISENKILISELQKHSSQNIIKEHNTIYCNLSLGKPSSIYVLNYPKQTQDYADWLI